MNNKRYFVITMTLSAAAAAGVFLLQGTAVRSAMNAAAAAVFTTIAAEDAMTKEIHDVLLAALYVTGLLLIANEPGMFPAKTAGALCLSVPMAIVNGISKIFFETDSLGSGDIILCGAAGLILGWEDVLTAGAAAFIVSGVCAAVMLVTGKMKKDDTIPLGPFLCTSFVLFLCF